MEEDKRKYNILHLDFRGELQISKMLYLGYCTFTYYDSKDDRKQYNLG